MACAKSRADVYDEVRSLPEWSDQRSKAIDYVPDREMSQDEAALGKSEYSDDEMFSLMTKSFKIDGDCNKENRSLYVVMELLSRIPRVDPIEVRPPSQKRMETETRPDLREDLDEMRHRPVHTYADRSVAHYAWVNGWVVNIHGSAGSSSVQRSDVSEALWLSLNLIMDDAVGNDWITGPCEDQPSGIFDQTGWKFQRSTWRLWFAAMIGDRGQFRKLLDLPEWVTDRDYDYIKTLFPMLWTQYAGFLAAQWPRTLNQSLGDWLKNLDKNTSNRHPIIERWTVQGMATTYCNFYGRVWINQKQTLPRSLWKLKLLVDHKERLYDHEADFLKRVIDNTNDGRLSRADGYLALNSSYVSPLLSAKTQETAEMGAETKMWDLIDSQTL